MKKALSLAILLVLLAGFLTAAVSAHADESAPVFSLEEVSPESPYPGQEVTAKVTYPVEFGESHAGKPVKYQVEAIDQAEVGEIRCPGGACAFTLAASGEALLRFYAPVKEDTFSFTLTLTVEGMPASPPLEIRALVVESALPNSLAQLFAGLGLFAAVMAIMALGTEVVIEFGKFFLGLKAKVSAMEAFNELKKELPGQLNQLGVDNKAIAGLDPIFQGLEATLKPVGQVQDVVAQISGGMFADAYRSLQEMGAINPKSKDANQKFSALKETTKAAVRRGLFLLAQKLPLAQAKIPQIEAGLLAAIDRLQLSDVANAAQLFFTNLQTAISDHEPEWIKQWLLAQADDLVKYNQAHLLGLAEDNIFEPILGLGFDPASVQALRARFTGTMDTMSGYLLKQANTYSESIKNLLTSVEEQRNQYQSPARKIWRRLRESALRIGWAALIAGIVWMLVWKIANLWPVSLAGAAIGLQWLNAFFAGLAAGLLLWAAAGLNQRYWSPPDRLPPGDPNRNLTETLGYFLRFGAERGFNYLMGRKSSMVAALAYGEVDEGLAGRIEETNPQTLAKTLLYLDEKHQDEEVSRVRMIRVLSLIIGTYLAYRLQIDAATYLNYAIPGIEEQINAVNVSLTQSQPEQPALTVGMILTGLAASAGSKFWRDMLARLQSTREQAEEAARLVRSLKGTVADLTGGKGE